MAKAPWVWQAVGAAALVAFVFLTKPAGGSIHPTPRPGITAEKILPDFAIPAEYRRLGGVRGARRAAPTLDGVYCHCDCSKHAGHRSLLTCFESNHGATATSAWAKPCSRVDGGAWSVADGHRARY